MTTDVLDLWWVLPAAILFSTIAIGTGVASVAAAGDPAGNGPVSHHLLTP
jgi:hypothetical protein